MTTILIEQKIIVVNFHMSISKAIPAIELKKGNITSDQQNQDNNSYMEQIASAKEQLLMSLESGSFCSDSIDTLLTESLEVFEPKTNESLKVLEPKINISKTSMKNYSHVKSRYMDVFKKK